MTRYDLSYIKSYVTGRILREYNLKIRAKQRNRKIGKVDKISDLKKWDSTYREQCICFGKDKTYYYRKWGHFKPKERRDVDQSLNVDQSPLLFILDAKQT